MSLPSFGTSLITLTKFRKISLFLFLCMGGFLIQCGSDEVVYEIEADKDLIAEGIALNPENGMLYLSSYHKKKIVSYDPGSSTSEDFIKSGEHGFKGGVGMLVHNDQLFTLSSEKTAAHSASLLLVFDPGSSRLLHSYALPDTVAHFMNDLAIGPGNDIYITDTERHMVYRLSYPQGTITMALQDESLKYPNGIAISDDGSKLYVDSWTHGIRIVDTGSWKILNGPHSPTSQYGIDGLKYHRGNLYAISNGGSDKSRHGLVRIALNPAGDSLGAVTPVLLGHEKMDIPTTFAIHDGYAYILANSQLESLDQETNLIREPDSLTYTYIIRKKL